MTSKYKNIKINLRNQIIVDAGLVLRTQNGYSLSK